MKFKFVYIPADRDRELEQWSLTYEKDKEVECLLDRLKSHFTTMHPPISARQKQRHKMELLKQKGLQADQVPDNLLEAATDIQLVESIALLPCMPQNDCTGITMYIDDSGSFKQLPVNARATDIAQICGLTSTAIVGDAFMARVRENDEEFERKDFLVSELSSNAEWMKKALAHNQNKMSQPTAQEILDKMKSERSGSTSDQAESARLRGNEAYKRKDYKNAIELYSECVDLDEQSALAFSNRSMAYLQLKQYSKALEDVESALRLDSNSVKAHYRKGLALEGLGRHSEAQASFRKVLELEPHSKAAADKLK